MLKVLLLIVVSVASFIFAQEPDSRCPLVNDRYGVRNLPHDTDCSSFFKCHLGSKYLMKCPNGMGYDFPSQDCKTTALAVCYTGEPATTVTTPALVTTTIGVPTAPPVDTTTTAAGGIPTAPPVDTTTTAAGGIPTAPPVDTTTTTAGAVPTAPPVDTTVATTAGPATIPTAPTLGGTDTTMFVIPTAPNKP